MRKYCYGSFNLIIHVVKLPYNIFNYSLNGDHMNNMICTFYARVSTDSDEQIDALENQEEYWLDYFKKHNLKMNPNCGAYYSREGVLLPRNGYYIDEGISGYKSKKYRKAFLKMIEDAKQGKFNMIYTRSISRFGRNVRDVLNTIELLRQYNVGIFFEDINLNTLDPNDNLKLLIFAGLAEEESRLKSLSVQKGKVISAKKGVWSGRAPYGYDIYTGELEINGVKQFVKGVLVINESEANVVRTIFNLYLNGWGLNRIAKYLNRKNIPRKRNSNKWDESIISKMLRNPIYKGDVWLHRTYVKDPKLNIVEKVPEHEQIRYHDERLRIIDDDTFEKVQQIKKERFEMFGDFKYKTIKEIDEFGQEKIRKIRIGIDRKNQRYSGAYLFSNLLKCGNCGSSLRFKRQKSTSGRIHHYWFCSNNDRAGQCKYRNLQREEELIEWVKNEIEKFRSNELHLKFYLEMLMKNQFEQVNIENKIILLKEKIKELKNEADTNIKVFSKGYIEEDEFAERAERLKKELKSAENELHKLLHIEVEKKQMIEKFNEFVNELRSINLEKLDNQTLRKIIDKIICTTKNEEEHLSLIHGNVFEPYERKIIWKFMNQSELEIEEKYTKNNFYVDKDEYLDPETLMPIF